MATFCGTPMASQWCMLGCIPGIIWYLTCSLKSGQNVLNAVVKWVLGWVKEQRAILHGNMNCHLTRSTERNVSLSFPTRPGCPFTLVSKCCLEWLKGEEFHSFPHRRPFSGLCSLVPLVNWDNKDPRNEWQMTEVNSSQKRKFSRLTNGRKKFHFTSYQIYAN